MAHGTLFGRKMQKLTIQLRWQLPSTRHQKTPVTHKQDIAGSKNILYMCCNYSDLFRMFSGIVWSNLHPFGP